MKLIRVDKKNPRRKKWEHFKLRLRISLFRISYLLNLTCALYLAHEQGFLTNIYSKLAPILEGLITKLPL